MSELKGMVVFAVSEPCKDGSFFIKKSIRDGSLAIFDDSADAENQLRRNDIDENVVNECLLVRAERARNVNDELSSLTEIIRLKEEENKQLAEDKAELVELVKSAYIEGCHDGYSEGLSDGQNWSSSKNNLEPDESWEISNSKALLEKHK